MLRRYFRTELSPWQWCLAILMIVFVCEFAVMLSLPFLLPPQADASHLALVDAGLLTTLLVPLFWWMIVRPLHRMSKSRAELLDLFIQMQEDERGRIARDLHDEIGQSFTSVLLGMKTFDFETTPAMRQTRMNELTQVITQTLNEVRRVARGLRPSVLDHLGLTQAIEQYLEDFGEHQPVKIHFNKDGINPEERWPAKVEISIYRIVQEALTNIARHAQAKHVTISLLKSEQNLQMEIHDDGQGFDVDFDAIHAARANSMGLLGMAERVTLLKGTFQVESQPGQGTRICLSIPLTPRK